MSSSPIILTFDSGLGGLTVFREIVKVRPDARHVYVADDARFPYGRLPDGAVIARVREVIGRMSDCWRPELVVVACNTASTIALPDLRARFSIPFVGTVPAIKPACVASKSKRISVLGTEATVRREYTRKLIADFAGACAVTLVGSARLASMAEAELHGEPAPDAEIAAEIAPCFVDDGARRTDTVVLACTHYPLLIARLHKLAPWPVAFLDPAAAIARRVVDLAGPAVTDAVAGPTQLVFTSGGVPSPTLTAALAGFGFRATVVDSPALPA